MDDSSDEPKVILRIIKVFVDDRRQTEWVRKAEINVWVQRIDVYVPHALVQCSCVSQLHGSRSAPKNCIVMGKSFGRSKALL